MDGVRRLVNGYRRANTLSGWLPLFAPAHCARCAARIGLRTAFTIGPRNRAPRQRSANVCPPVEERWPLVNEGAQLRLPATERTRVANRLGSRFYFLPNLESPRSRVALTERDLEQKPGSQFYFFPKLLIAGLDGSGRTGCDKSLVLAFSSCPNLRHRCRSLSDFRSSGTARRKKRRFFSVARRRFRRFHCSVPTAVRMKPSALAGA